MRRLVGDIEKRSKGDVQWDEAFRIVKALWTQLSRSEQAEFADVLRQIEADFAPRHRRLIDQRRVGASELPQELSVERCPQCGAELVRKTAHKGRPDEHEFMSCSRFPECRFGYDLSKAGDGSA